MSENKKIINASPTVYKDIQFKSKLEVMAYKMLEEEGFNPEYEKCKFILMKGFYPNTTFYRKNNRGDLEWDMAKIRDITYTPDITFTYKGIMIIIELKGKMNDTYPIKKKLFRKFLDDSDYHSIFFEIYNKKQLVQAINLIKQLNNYE